MQNKIIIVALISIIFFMFLLPLLLLGTLDSLAYFSQPSTDFKEELFGERLLKQEFIAYRNNFNAVGMSINNPNFINKKEIYINLYEGRYLLRSVELKGTNISAGSLVKIEFSPIRDSMNKKYSIEINSPKSSSGEAFYVSLTKNSSQELENLLINNNKTDRKIALIGYYKISNRIEIIRYVYNDFFLNFFKDSKFAIFYLSIIAGLFVGVLKNSFNNGK